MTCCFVAVLLAYIKLNSVQIVKQRNVSVSYFNYRGVWMDHSSFNMWFDTFVLQVYKLLRLVCQIRPYCCYIMY